MKEPKKIERTHIVRKEVYDLDTEEGRPRIRWLTKWTFDGDRTLLTVDVRVVARRDRGGQVFRQPRARRTGELFHAAPCVRCNRYVRALDKIGRAHV